MRFGGYYPDLKLRLFRRITNSGPAHFTVRPVHESVQVEGRVDTMQNDFLHHGYPQLDINHVVDRSAAVRKSGRVATENAKVVLRGDGGDCRAGVET